MSTLFAALLGYNPVRTLLAPIGLLKSLPSNDVAVLTSRTFFPDLIAGPFHQGMITVFTAAVAVCGHCRGINVGRCTMGAGGIRAERKCVRSVLGPSTR